MANISDANGVFKLDIPEESNLTNDDIEALLLMIQKELLDNAGDYMTILNCFTPQDELNLNEFVTETEDYDEYETGFAGTGRWLYSTNATSMFEWITQSYDFQTNKSIINHSYDDLLHKLSDLNVQFIFDYIEYEPGALPESLLKTEIVVRPYFNKETNLFETDVINHNETTEPVTIQKMEEHGFISEHLTLDDFKNKTENVLKWFSDDEIEEFLDEYEDEFEDADGTISVYAPEEEVFIPQ